MASAASRPPAILLLLLALAAPAAAAAPADDVRVLAADRLGVTFELATPEPVIDPITGTGGVLLNRVGVPGWGSTTTVGRPGLPARSILLQVPPAGPVSVEVEEGPCEVRHGLEVAPVEALAAGGGASADEAPAARSADPAYPGLWPPAPYELSARAVVRGVRVMRLTLLPFSWDAATGELSWATTMRVRVRFEEPLPASDPSARTAAEDPAGTLGQVLVNPGPVPAPPPPAVPVPVSSTPQGRVRLRMEVPRDGLYRVTAADLRAAGVKPRTVDPRTLRVLAHGREVAIRVVSASSRRLSADGYLEFYALGLDNAFTNRNVYWLRWNGKRGLRLGETDGAPIPGAGSADTFPEEIVFEENHRIWDTTPGAPEADYWYWQLLQSPGSPSAPATATYALEVPTPAPGIDALLTLTLRGRTTEAHHARAYLNDVLVGDEQWTGTDELVAALPVAAGLLGDGANALRVELVAGTGVDQVYFNRVSVSYERSAAALAGELRIVAPPSAGDRTFEVTGAGAEPFQLLDVTDPWAPSLLAGVEATGGGSPSVRFGVPAGPARVLHLVPDGAVRQPSAITRWKPRLLRPAAGADYILVAPRAFLGTTGPLRELRREQGLRVAAAAIEDVFNVYGDGIPDPAALKAFVADAYATWPRPAPAYLFLLGDATFDYRDYLGTGKRGHVPVHLSATAELGVTPDDGWYAAVDGDDDLPDLFVGRVTAGSRAEAKAVVDKIVSYERAPRPSRARALFVADNNELVFPDLAERLAAVLPPRVAARRAYLPDCSGAACQPLAADVRQRIIDQVNRGTLLTTYVGHGDVTGWAGETTALGERIMDAGAVALLDNPGRLTFAVVLDCLSGFFARHDLSSIAELLANAPSAGAVASFAPSGLGYTWEHDLLGQELFDRAFTRRGPTLGALTTGAELRAHGRGARADMVTMFNLLGDPATRLAVPGR